MGGALVAWFDLASSLPFNDEFFYQWTVRRLGDGQGLHLFPGQAPIALVQLALGALAWAAGHDPRVVRLTAIPFLVLAAWALYALARDLGARRFYAGVAAGLPVAMPVSAASATGFMSEPFYLGLLLVCCLAATRWLDTRRGGALVVVTAALCALERQHAAAIPPALTIAFMLPARARRPDAADVGWLVATWAAVAAGLVLPPLAGLQTEQMTLNASSLAHPDTGATAAMLLYLAPMLGLAVLPFAGALPWRKGGGRPWWSRPVVPAYAGLVVITVLVTFVLPGNYLTRAGLNPVTIAGNKPDLYGALVPAMGLLGLGSLFLVVARPRWTWGALWGDARAVFLVSVGAIALVPMLNGDVFDRYYLPAILPVVPLAAALATGARWPRFGRAFAVVALLAGLAIYAAGEQDYQAWQQARDQAERVAEQSVPARFIFSGFETYGVLVVLPDYERSGSLPALAGRRTTVLEAPSHPRLALLISGPGDPRPGVSYRSLASGRVVIERLPAASGP